MLTRIEVTARGTSLTSGALAARQVRGPEGTVRIALVGTQALLLAGDRVRVEVVVDDGRHLELVEVAGTVAYDMRGGSATWEVDVRLRGRSRLSWRGEPLVVASGASVTRSSSLDLDAGCVAALREPVVLGRTGEVGGDLRTSTRVAYDGQPLLAEDLDLSAAARSGPAVLGPSRCLDTSSLFGARLDEAPGVLQLEGPGSVARWIGDDLHASPLAGDGSSS